MRCLRSIATCALAVLSLAGCSADAAEPLSPTASIPAKSTSGTLSITISGPTEVATWWSCSWTAYVSGGTPPYTYHWGATGMTETELYDSYWRGYAAVGGTVGLNVSVIDANGKTGSGYLLIDSSSNNPLCHD